MALWWDGCKAKRLTSLKIYLAEVQSIFLLPHTFSTDKKAKRVLIRFEQSLASPHIVLHWMLFLLADLITSSGDEQGCGDAVGKCACVSF